MPRRIKKLGAQTCKIPSGVLSEISEQHTPTLSPPPKYRSKLRRSGAAPETSAAAPSSSGSLFIQTNEPWTVVLDAEGNPSAVIVGGAPSRPARSALFGR
jgi:hypothetical protein